MINTIIQAVNDEIALQASEQDDLRILLAAAGAGMQQANIAMTEEGWLRMGVHLVAALRRAYHGETLPDIDESMLAEVGHDMQELSRKVLQAVGPALACDNMSEVFLLAVHFAAAKHNDQS